MENQKFEITLSLSEIPRKAIFLLNAKASITFLLVLKLKAYFINTTGVFFLFQSHFKELLLEHAPPPPALAEFAIANLIKMGFPQRAAEGSISICSCHKESKVGEGYICPRCKARVCELPTECCICGLTLVSSPHLARSYHHLFPIAPFDEVTPSRQNERRSQKTCFGCQQSLFNPGELDRCEGFVIERAHSYMSLSMTMPMEYRYNI